LAGARVVIGLDTGLTHLAAALGRPTVGIYCDYDPSLVGLVGDGPVRSLGGVGRPPSGEDVIAAVRGALQRARTLESARQELEAVSTSRDVLSPVRSLLRRRTSEPAEATLARAG